MPKVAVILFPGLNMELEIIRACHMSGIHAEVFRWNDDYSRLKKFDAYVIPGGFSYEDRGRSGVIASKDPIMQVIKTELEKGKPGLGICNGAQIFVETGLIPGLNENDLKMALAPNERIQNGKILGTGYYNDWVYMKHETKSGRSIFNRFAAKEILRIPVAHGEGRYTTQDKNLLKNLIEKEQTLFRYCDANGKFKEEFPVNPNGAIYNLAGVCNPEGNILALMPHAERSESGLKIFHSMADYLQNSNKKVSFSSIKKGQKTKELTVSKNGSKEVIFEKLQKKPDVTLLVKLIITDNEEKTLENTVRRIGYDDVRLSRQIFLGLYLKDKKNLKETAKKMIESGELLNLHKEIPTVFIGDKIYTYDKSKGFSEIKNPLTKGFSFFVSEHNNYSGKNLQFNLQNHLKNNLIEKIERGIFWTMEVKDKKKVNEIMETHVFHNPHSMKVTAF